MKEKIKGLVLKSELLGKKKEEPNQWFKILIETDTEGRKLSPGQKVSIQEK